MRHGINSSRQIAFGAMMMAIMGLFVLLNRAFSTLGSGLFLFIYPMPMLVFSAYYGWKVSWKVLLAMILMVPLISASPSTAVMAIGQAVVGLVYGCNLHEDVSPSMNLLSVMLMSAGVLLLQIVIAVNLFGYSKAYLTGAASLVCNNILHISMVPETVSWLYICLFVSLIGLLDGWIIARFATFLLDRLYDIKVRP